MKNKKEMKKSSIQKRYRYHFTIVAMIAVIFTGIFASIGIQNVVNSAADSMKDRLKKNVSNLAAAKAMEVRKQMGTYVDELELLQTYIENIYKYPWDYMQKEVYPPYEAWDGYYVTTRVLASPEISYEEVKDELMLVGNSSVLFEALMERKWEALSAIYYASESGFLLTANDYNTAVGIQPDKDGEAYFDYYGRTWYAQTKKRKDIHFTGVYEDESDQGLMVTCSAPIYTYDTFQGVVGMDISIERLLENLFPNRIAGNYSEYLIGEDGKIIAMAGTQGNAWEEMRDSEHQEAQSVYSQDCVLHEAARVIMDPALHDSYEEISTNIVINGGDMLFIDTIDETGWALCVLVSGEEIERPLNEMKSQMLQTLYSFIGILVIIILAVNIYASILSKRVALPIEELTKDVEQMRDGNLQHRAKILVNDEVGELAVCVNHMAESLQKYIENLTQVTAEKERIGAELGIATNIQASMLPSVFPPFPDRTEFDICASMDPAKEVGGDFYDFFFVDDRHFAIVVADVSGKGVPAALFMVIGKTLIKDQSMLNVELQDVFANVNNLLCESNAESLFITAFEAIIDLETGDVTYVNAGHEEPYIRHGDGEFERLAMEPGFVLAGLNDMQFQTGHFHLEPGDQIFQYTDGVPDALNAQEEQYGTDRLAQVLQTVKGAEPSEVLAKVKEDMDAFVGGAEQFDDITMLCFNYHHKMHQMSEE